jgi:hypothetical protein
MSLKKNQEEEEKLIDKNKKLMNKIYWNKLEILVRRN